MAQLAVDGRMRTRQGKLGGVVIELGAQPLRGVVT